MHTVASNSIAISTAHQDDCSYPCPITYPRLCPLSNPISSPPPLPTIDSPNTTLSNAGYNCTHLAAVHGKCGVLQVLLRERVDLTQVDRRGWSAVHHAAFHGKLGILQVCMYYVMIYICTGVYEGRSYWGAELVMCTLAPQPPFQLLCP